MRLRRTAVLLPLVVVVAALTACTGTSTGQHGTATVAAASSQVSFVVDGTPTYGTLAVPAHRSGQRLAAALLIPGSGPTDRDGNEPSAGLTPDTLKLIADILAKQGIVTFRFDKYFTGRTGAGRYASDPSAATIGGDLHQADAAFNFLSEQQQVDPAKLLLVGHSEGGMVVMQIADTARTKPVGIALLEPQDVRALDLLRIQWDEAINSLVAQGTLSVAQARANADLISQAVAQFRAGQSVTTAGMAAQVAQMVSPFLATNNQSAYLRSWDLVSPVNLAAKIKNGTRVLVTDGTRDDKVPPTTIGPLIRALTSAGLTGPGLRLVQGTDHDMHAGSQPDNDPVLAPDIVTAIEQWAAPYAE